jgi:uncharacterized protein (TIGR00375 family)
MPTMRFHADLHIHSKFSRACSRDCDLEHLAWWAGRKGVAVVGTGDFTHPGWIDELRSQLVPAEPGLFRLQPDVERRIAERLPPSCRTPVRFLLSSEISTIYKRDDRTRKVHHLLYAPDFDAVDRITQRLARIGNLSADGRPILGLDSRHLLEITLESGPDCYLVPAHAWTPWFAVLGSQSGFDAVDDCYGDLAEHIFAVETGLSSDPEMNWRVSSLDRFRLVSNSDAHSPPMLAREATVFDTDVDYFAMRRALQTGDGFGGTVEFFPEEGKYHLDGHRACGIRTEPEETRGLDGRCPACGKPLTVGVLHRVEALADRPSTYRPADGDDFSSLIPLPEIVGEILGVGPKSKTVTAKVSDLVGRLGPELAILRDVPLDDVAAVGSSVLVEALGRLRRREVVREAGFDGEYGTIRLFDADELAAPEGSQTLFAVPGPASDALGRRGRRLPTPPTSSSPTAGRTAPGAPSASASGPAPAPAPGDGGRPLATVAAHPEPAVPAVLDGLDRDQRAAVVADGGPLLVVAGPGTGKTRVLTRRLAYRVVEDGVAPERCLALTFTRRAAAEMEDRLRHLVTGRTDHVPVATFHRLGLQLVREHHEALGLAATVSVAHETLRLDLVMGLRRCGRAEGQRLMARLADAKRRRAVSPGASEDATAHDEQAFSDLLTLYDEGLRSRGLVDVDDLLTLPVTLLQSDPALAGRLQTRWSDIGVDEYQDVDELQYRLLRLITRPDGNLCAIGDPDQAIYGFRGGDVGYFLRFRHDFPTARVVELTRSYRSTPTIVRAALGAIAPATLVPDRALSAERTAADDGPIAVHRAAGPREEGEVVADAIERTLGGASFWTLDRRAADGSTKPGLSFADFAVLYRTDAQARPIADALDRRGFPVQVRSHERLVDRPEVRAVVAALDARRTVARPLAGGAPTVSVAEQLDRAIDVAGRPGGASRVDPLAVRALLRPLAESYGTDLDRFLDDVELWTEVDTWDARADRISLLTLHAAKGLEFPVVFVVGCEDGLLPFHLTPAAGDGDTAEERRLFFVGMTRAIDRLVLTSAATRHRWGAVREQSVSPFVGDIDSALVEAVPGPGRDQARRSTSGRQLRLL